MDAWPNKELAKAPTRFHVYLKRWPVERRSSPDPVATGASSKTSVSPRQAGVATRHSRELRRV